ncbi:MAG: hypothetical protein U1G08_07820 [Verrucomicrobiota bacterium]
MTQTQNITHDFGHFEGYNFRHQTAIERLLTATEVVQWDHDRHGEAEFWPAGDKREISLIFRDQSAVTATELLELSVLLGELEDDSTENYLSVYFALSVGEELGKVTADRVRDLAPCCLLGGNFTDVRREAAYELFELYFPELYHAWESTPCDGLIFDTDLFLDSPSFNVVEVELGGEVAVLVAPW